ncbi:MAG: shikimate kinase [Bacteriovoracaceae bacterium]|nr:shikimate kinase [Bacteriovoracaceae bacterium]
MLKQAAVIGHPVTHSLSPLIFSFLGRRQNTKINYDRIDLKSKGEVEQFFLNLRKQNDWSGVNVTLPWKEAAFQLVDEWSIEAKKMGVCNVVKNRAGKLIGHNTDIWGIEQTINSFSHHHAIKNAVILGSGGAAKSVAYDLEKRKIPHVALLKRGDRYPSQKSNGPIDLIVHTTPLGMTGFKDNENSEKYFQILDEMEFQENAIAFDLIYTPVETPFLRRMKNKVKHHVGGLGMLVDQAIKTWEIWLGEKIDHLMRSELLLILSGALKMRENGRPIFLCGFMGVGKSTVGKILSQLLGAPFYDLDSLIEDRAKKKISAIFKDSGESEFRKLETEILTSLDATNLSIVALGGGAMNKEENRAWLKEKGEVVYLKASMTNLMGRLKQDEKTKERPLAQLDLSVLFKMRSPLYETAHQSIDTDSFQPLDVAFQVLQSLGHQ